VLDSLGEEIVIRIHNCLLCETTSADDTFNLISVSQLLRSKRNSVQFQSQQSTITLSHPRRTSDVILNLVPDDGLYALDVRPMSPRDARKETYLSFDLTVNEELVRDNPTAQPHNLFPTPATKSPTKLGIWYTRILWVGHIISLVGKGFTDELKDFCATYVAPLSIPPARRTYQTTNVEDLADLSVRFLGVGTERLKKTIERSIGLSPLVKINGKMRHPRPVPVHNFPQGRWKTGKTPKVEKGIVSNLHQASIGEVVFMDSFEVEDSKYRYGQAFVDYRSNFGDIIPMKTRSQAGWSFATFCARNYTPLILIRDNIGENIGGQLMVECLKRSVRSAFICPYRKQQNYAEGYLGRITALASYGMVYSGAPMFMWIWSVACAVFINNITAAFYSVENAWATPYELTYNEPFPDASIVIPFGCGVLVLLTDEERGKFQSRCALMVFIHYANQHPLYTYAVYSPRTRRVLYRQDCIFLTNLFPMRTARANEGLSLEGDVIIPYRSPESVRAGGPESLSFQEWDHHQPIPDYQDHITGHKLVRPSHQVWLDCKPKPLDYPTVQPNDPRFGPQSVVKVPFQSGCSAEDKIVFAQQQLDPFYDVNDEDESDKVLSRTRRNDSKKVKTPKETKRRPVKQRWFYEPVSTPALVSQLDLEGEKMLIAGEPQIGESLTSINMAVPEIELSTNEEINFDKSKCGLPDSVGIVEVISDEGLASIPINENGACMLQGTLFFDNDLQWCRINGWGVENGIPIVFYSAILMEDTPHEEDYASLAQMLALLRQSPVPAVVPKFVASRILQKSEHVRRSLCLKQVGYSVQHAAVPEIGQFKVHLLGARLGSYNGHVLTGRTIKRILRAQETIFKYGTLIPRNDAEASKSPEAIRWISGKNLEWIRLKNATTFETQWTWDKVRKAFPDYKKADIGHLFFIYDYKFSGEHRVRLVFDGSRQSAATYNETYAPTVRPESVRLFHIYAVEYSWSIRQFDVPQAFLRSDADCDIFVYPPTGFAEFPGQVLKLAKMLYGSKQAAHLWFNLLNEFLLEIGFVASSMDPCFYRRAIVPATDIDASSDAIIILHVDDMRVAATDAILIDLHAQLFAKFEITTSDAGRFLGMDTDYNMETGTLRMHMDTYITSTVERFTKFDLSLGIPYRELIGCLLWIVLCIMGPELLRIKDLARRSNNFTELDYQDALKALKRLEERKSFGIVYRRGGAGKENIPASSRLGGGVDTENRTTCDIGEDAVAMLLATVPYSTGDGISDAQNELKENDIYKLDILHDDATLDIVKVLAPTNTRFTKVAYSDASFAVGIGKQSISGFIIFINGTPLLWGSLKQTVVVDSTCSAEYVASSICCKQILQAENMVQFLCFTCPKPYTMYTDSSACLAIASMASKLGKVRHVEIRYHLVRCLVISGDIRLVFCITEDMIADVFTKIVAGAQDARLSARFYNDCNELLFSGEVNM
jgi:hypothetical protein